jgi:hypothetical protein
MSGFFYTTVDFDTFGATTPTLIEYESYVEALSIRYLQPYIKEQDLIGHYEAIRKEQQLALSQANIMLDEFGQNVEEQRMLYGGENAFP